MTKPVQPTQPEKDKADRDCHLFGTGVLKDGKHVPLNQVYLQPTQGVRTDKVTGAVQSICDLLEPFLDDMNDHWQDEIQRLNPITAAHTEAEKTIATIGQCIRAIRSARAALAERAK